MASKHGIVGGGEFGTELPVMEVPEQDLTAERNAAKFSRTKEYLELKEHLQRRIAYYQTFLPSGVPVLQSELSSAELGARWGVANGVIMELQGIIDAYETASEVVRDATQRQNS